MDRNEAIEHLKVVLKTCDVQDEEAVEMAIKALEQPEIIRCKECKYWKEKPLYTYCGKMYGMGILDVLDYATEENDFCSMAERRGEADEQ